jgi:hypothetical protein
MRYCVSGRQPYSVLKKADEIKVNYIDRERIFDFVENIPNKTIILDVPGDEAEWETWAMYGEKFNEFYIALHNLKRYEEFAGHGVKWYWPYPITSYYELNKIIALKPSYLMIGPPLSFDLERVRALAYADGDATPIPLRMVCNNAKPDYLPKVPGQDGVCGQWVRPEDAAHYEFAVQCFEFENVDLKQEETLLAIYKENQTWPGNLNLIIQNLNFNVDNRVVPIDMVAARTNCGQRCFSTSSCKLCISALKFADQLRKEKYKREQRDNIDNN